MRKRVATVTPERLRELLDYNPETGVFTWKAARRWGRAGTVAGSPNGNGYVRIWIDGDRYVAHRLAYLHVHGVWPPVDLDHEKGARSDNRIAHLRPATKSQNSANAKRRWDNTSGFKGVHWAAKRRRWQALITVNREHIFLGEYRDVADAHAAYAAAAKRFFGEFARAS